MTFFRSRPLLTAMIPIAHWIAGCSSTPVTEPSDGQPGKSTSLHRDTAMYRSRQVQKIQYRVWLQVDETSEEFRGRTRIAFEVREHAFRNTKTLQIDFTSGNITSLVLNGRSWEAAEIAKAYDGARIKIGKSDLAIGPNQIEIAYTHPYSKSGNGFHRFKDPEDGAVYLRTDLEPYYANLVIPSFDQPDLKASFELVVEAPPAWTIVGNMPLREKTKVDGRLSWSFPPTPPMSTYLFAVMAGPWKAWKSSYKGLPLGLYARQTVAKYVDANEWFRITSTGLDFFSDYFGTQYPYPKYDQLLVPDHNAGAMENIGAVTFNEGFIFRGPATVEKKRDRADTILHEMAHMWFGNLVTMRWWNGLWLNESFATYLASVALERTKLFPGAPQSFFSGMKRWAYSEDQLPTTHPVEVSVIDTNQAMANFDGITYGKGAAALKQFHYGIGDEDFQEGLARYFARFANHNTALADFINVMATTSGKDLAPWVRSWLHTRGYNRIGAEFTCGSDGKIATFDLVQTTEGKGNPLRPHRLQVGLYYRDSNGRLAKKEDGVAVTAEGPRTAVADVIGKACPDLVFPNDDDYGYFLTELDPKSLSTAKSSLARISDPFTRHLLAFTLWEMVKTGKWTAAEFGAAATEWLAVETNQMLIEDVSEMIAHPRHTRITAARLLEGEARTKLNADLHALARKKTVAARSGSDLQRIWFGAALRTLAPTDAPWALSVYQGKTKIRGLKIDPDLRWDILVSIARVASIERKVLEDAAKEDPSSEGGTRLLAVVAALENPLSAAPTTPQGTPLSDPILDLTPARLESLFTLETTDEKIPVAKLRKAMGNYLSLSRPERIQAWTPKYFAALSEVAAKSDDSYFRQFAQALYPGQCSDAIADQTTKWLRSNSNAPRTLRIALRKMAFAEKWCAALRAGRPFPLWQDEEKD